MDVGRLTDMIRKHVGTEANGKNLWSIAESPISGRGVFASKDILPGQTILVDRPLLIGPRVKGPLACVGCFGKVEETKECEGCRLPLCSSPACHASHKSSECLTVKRLAPKKGPKCVKQLYWALTPLRGLAMTEEAKELMSAMQANEGSQHGFEVTMLYEAVSGKLSEEEEGRMENCCRVLDSVAFEVETGQGSARGLYPLAGLLNHSCCPNTRHMFRLTPGKNGGVVTFEMVMVAAVEIKKGEELTSHYCPLLWGTPARRHYLSETKHFLCSCPRCSDPTEFGTYFSGLRCLCKAGRLVPERPLDPASKWVCSSCGGKLTAKDATLIQAKLTQFVLKEQTIELPSLCQVTVQQALQSIWKMDNPQILRSMSDEQLKRIESKIRSILDLIMDLKLGMCRMRGLLLFHLYVTKLEWQRREQKIEKEACWKILQEAAQILKDDTNVPKQLFLYLESAV